MTSRNYLKHYGILGMKWGQRKGDTSKMSDNELRQSINRLQMEQQYSKLSPSSVQTGTEYASKIFKTGMSVAAATTAALTIYDNANKIKKIVTT